MIYDMDDMFITYELDLLLFQDVDAWRKLQ